jgi:hypothetical protein
MAATSVNDSISGSRGLLAGEFVDSLIEAVVLASGPLARSAVICELLKELCDAVEWLHAAETLPDDSADQETASLHELLVATHGHQFRMSALCTDAEGHRSTMSWRYHAATTNVTPQRVELAGLIPAKRLVCDGHEPTRLE